MFAKRKPRNPNANATCWAQHVPLSSLCFLGFFVALCPGPGRSRRASGMYDAEEEAVAPKRLLLQIKATIALTRCLTSWFENTWKYLEILFGHSCSSCSHDPPNCLLAQSPSKPRRQSIRAKVRNSFGQSSHLDSLSYAGLWQLQLGVCLFRFWRGSGMYGGFQRRIPIRVQKRRSDIRSFRRKSFSRFWS